MKDLFIQHKDILNELVRYGILRAEVLDDYGLYGGKLGMAILFYEYSRFRENQLYKQFADELIDSVLVVPDSLSVRFDNGLSGIGWGIIYLLREKFVEGNVDDVLIDLDRQLISQNLFMCNEDIDILTYIEFRRSYSVISDRSVLLEYIHSNQFKNIERIKLPFIYQEQVILRNIWKTWKI